MLCPCSVWGRTARACRGASCATYPRRQATASAWTDHGMIRIPQGMAVGRHDAADTGDGPQLSVVRVRPERADRVDGVGFGSSLVLAISQDASEPQRDAARIAPTGLDAIERDLCH